MDHSEVKHLPKVDHTPAKLAEWQRLLLTGASLIEIRGHNKGSFEARGKLCFRGSLHVASSGKSDHGGPGCDEASARFLQALHKRGLGQGGWLMWNDEPSRTSAEVVSLMRAVALGNAD